jgi:hypothetical protein
MGDCLVEVFEFWEYSVTCFDKETNSGGLFAEYVNMFLKLKRESSGFPSWVQSEDDKERYIGDYRRAEEIALDKASISKSSGQRTLAVEIKLCGVNGRRTKTKPRQQLLTRRKFDELLTSPGTEVTNLIFRKNEVAWIFWKYSDNNVATGKNVNVAVAAYVTHKLGLNCTSICVSWVNLSCTVIDSVIYIQNVDEPPKVETGYYLGDLTDELEEFVSGSYIQEFVSGGPKNYAFSVFSPLTGKSRTRCKVKGKTLNYDNSGVVNFTSLRNMILEDTPLHVHNPRKIKRKYGGVVVSDPERKEYKVVFKKRWLMETLTPFHMAMINSL